MQRDIDRDFIETDVECSTGFVGKLSHPPVVSAKNDAESIRVDVPTHFHRRLEQLPSQSPSPPFLLHDKGGFHVAMCPAVVYFDKSSKMPVYERANDPSRIQQRGCGVFGQERVVYCLIEPAAARRRLKTEQNSTQFRLVLPSKAANIRNERGLIR